MNKNNNVVVTLLALFAGATVGCANEVGPSPDDAGSGLAVRLASLEAGSSRIEYSLTNHSAQPLRVLARKTGLHPAHDPLFEIYRDGSRVDYRGPIFHHGPPELAHYLEVAPGERLAAEIDLDEFYDLRGGGTYEVRPLPLHPSSVRSVEAIELDTVTSLEIHVDAGNTVQGMPDVGLSSAALTVQNCSAVQTEMINAGRASALENAREAMDYIDEHQYDERAERWFGAIDLEGAYKVQNGMHVIHSLLEANTFHFICRPASYYRCWLNTWAFVNPWDASANKVINICPAGFDEAQPSGRDAFYTTITHEVAHFYTKDVDYGEYGVPGALELAQTNPKTAKKNAENYALYTIDSEIP